MASTSLYVKLTHVSSSPEENFASPAAPLVPYILAPSSMDPLARDTLGPTLIGPFTANVTTLAEPQTESAYNTTLPEPLTYQNDHYGAMVFIVATVCVYGLSIVFFIAGHTQKRELNKDEERQISHYLKRLHLEEPSMDNRKFHVIRLKSQLLAGSALGQRHNRRVSLLPRHLDQCMRLGVDRAEDDRESSDGEEPEAKASHPENPLLMLMDRESRVQNVNEESESSPPPSVPYRGRRFGCVGLSPAARVGDGFGADRPRPHLLTCPLPDIEEDEQSMRSVKDVLSTEQDSSEIQSPQPEDSPLNSSSEIVNCESSLQGLAQPLLFSESSERPQSQEVALDSMGSHDPVEEHTGDDSSCEYEITRL